MLERFFPTLNGWQKKKLGKLNVADGEIILYTTGCPRCIVLEKKLKEKGISFIAETNEDTMVKKGFMSSPILVKGGEVMDFSAAMAWLRTR